MNKKILIIGGVSVVLIVAGVWLYLFLSGKTSTTDGVFAEFSDGGDSVENWVLQDSVDDFDIFDGEVTQRLRQLTLRPVAGAVFVETGILYVEKGTGHIFNINLNTSNETLVSGTTLPKTRTAVFSKNGTYIAITNQINTETETVVGSVSVSGSLDGVSLPSGAVEISFDIDDNNILYYLIKNDSGSRGYLYDIELASGLELFSIPLKDVRVVWGDVIYVYTIPSSEQIGYVYEVFDNKLKYVTDGSKGLVVFSTSNALMVTKVTGPNFTAQPVRENNSVLFGALIPEKCTESEKMIVCAVPKTINPDIFPDVWYRGVFSFSDNLLVVDTENGGSRVLSDLFVESGREIDVIKIGADAPGERFYFINKNDNSLWLFDTTIID